MRSSPFLVAAFAAAALVACSRAEPPAVDDSLDRDLELALHDARPQATVSAVELGNARPTPPQAPAAPEHRLRAHAQQTKPQPAVEERAPVPTQVQAAPEPATQPVEAAPAEDVQPIAQDPQPDADAPAPEPAPEPERTRTGRGGGGWYPIPTDIGVERPGLPGGIIIIRGGAGSAEDPCDERDRHGRPGMGGMGGGVLINPRLPGRMGGGGGRGGFPGGGILR